LAQSRRQCRRVRLACGGAVLELVLESEARLDYRLGNSSMSRLRLVGNEKRHWDFRPRHVDGNILADFPLVMARLLTHLYSDHIVGFLSSGSLVAAARAGKSISRRCPIKGVIRPEPPKGPAHCPKANSGFFRRIPGRGTSSRTSLSRTARRIGVAYSSIASAIASVIFSARPCSYAEANVPSGSAVRKSAT
jgi:hypothetical protein